ncbi:protein-L-isoaspartate O-methyltransferase family protein [Falsirhodobacter halotolerans]|uniref:protein-L-isoaspartate O-methyltransferase family protein n=1 Tax=Falsirhodobacter halotolerans TaxID=1146892 RepID=UPI001FD22F68|nr:protein-L-isoaspartate O-methyltransferase [Falsirhodobacter halotolerans]MCJ8139439.1 protein-L-isoaspartate O-methyltransferase [Falsirhodobacter halotolerans]
MPHFTTLRTVMVDTQVRPSDVTTYSIIEALLSVPRECYVPDHLRAVAYTGENLPIGPNRVILDPRSFAKLLDALAIRKDELALDIGCGYGYSAAVIAHLADAVIAVEGPGMAEEAEQRLSRQSVDNAVVLAADLTAGAPKHGPYDVIVIEGAVEDVPPQIVDQLKEGGRIGALFMERNLGVARIGYKVDGAISWRPAFNASAPVMSDFTAPRAFAL